MIEPTNKENFLIEVTSEQLEELRAIYKYVDKEGYEVMHYSPYWKKSPPLNKTKDKRE